MKSNLEMIVDATWAEATDLFGEIPESWHKELSNLLRDWTAMVEEEARCLEAGEEGPMSMFRRSMDQLNRMTKDS